MWQCNGVIISIIISYAKAAKQFQQTADITILNKQNTNHANIGLNHGTGEIK